MLFYECVEEDALPELETVHADMKLGIPKLADILCPMEREFYLHSYT